MGIFDEIYSSNGWGFGSGHGSLPRVTRGYRQFLEMFIKENNVSTIVDYGCGDWQFSRLIDWGEASYIGVDVVSSVVEENNKKYGSKKIQFKTIKPNSAKEVPPADLLIIKDVLQHLPNDTVKSFIKTILPKYKYALITNCIIPTDELNKDIEAGGFRPLDLRKPPFNLAATTCYSFTGPKSFSRSERKFFPAWKKAVLLVS